MPALSNNNWLPGIIHTLHGYSWATPGAGVRWYHCGIRHHHKEGIADTHSLRDILVENLSVLIRVSWFKRTKKKYGVGRRVCLVAPLHHHYQKKGYGTQNCHTLLDSGYDTGRDV